MGNICTADICNYKYNKSIPKVNKNSTIVNIFTTISTVIYGKHVIVNEANSNVNTKRHLGNPDLFFAEFLISVFYILDYTLPNIILP